MFALSSKPKVGVDDDVVSTFLKKAVSQKTAFDDVVSKSVVQQQIGIVRKDDVVSHPIETVSKTVSAAVDPVVWRLSKNLLGLSRFLGYDARWYFDSSSWSQYNTKDWQSLPGLTAKEKSIVESSRSNAPTGGFGWWNSGSQGLLTDMNLTYWLGCVWKDANPGKAMTTADIIAMPFVFHHKDDFFDNAKGAVKDVVNTVVDSAKFTVNSLAAPLAVVNKNFVPFKADSFSKNDQFMSDASKVIADIVSAPIETVMNKTIFKGDDFNNKEVGKIADTTTKVVGVVGLVAGAIATGGALAGAWGAGAGAAEGVGELGAVGAGVDLSIPGASTALAAVPEVAPLTAGAAGVSGAVSAGGAVAGGGSALLAIGKSVVSDVVNKAVSGGSGGAQAVQAAPQDSGKPGSGVGVGLLGLGVLFVLFVLK